jgi:hypothetical protein
MEGALPPPPPPLCVSINPKVLVARLKKPSSLQIFTKTNVPVWSQIGEEQDGEFVELEPEHDDSVHHGGALTHVE